MTLSTDEIRVAMTGTISVAPAGSTLPTTLAALDAAFVDLGYTTPEGVTLRTTRTRSPLLAWQSLRPVRHLAGDEDASVAFILMQWNLTTVPLAFGGGTVTEPTAGVFRYDPPAAGEVDNRALVVEWEDTPEATTFNYRLVVPRGVASEGGETQLTRTAEGRLPITFSPEVTSDDDWWYLLTDDPAFDAVP